MEAVFERRKEKRKEKERKSLLLGFRVTVTGNSGRTQGRGHEVRAHPSSSFFFPRGFLFFFFLFISDLLVRISCTFCSERRRPGIFTRGLDREA